MTNPNREQARDIEARAILRQCEGYIEAFRDENQGAASRDAAELVKRIKAFAALPTPEAERVEIPAYHVVLKAMREAMESHPFWRKVKHTPAENDLPVRAANVAMQILGEL